MDKENKETVVLGVINHGTSKFDKILREAKVEPEELDDILQKLENSGLIKVNKKKGWISTKIEIEPTEKGYREFENRLKILQEKWKQLENTYKSGSKQELKQKLKENKSLLPSMMMFGIIDMMMFSMMFSMIGTSMGSFIQAEDMEMNDSVGNTEESDFENDDEFDIDIGF
tara:strand:- start:189 stop:701 length:513 start_codon:yes stop_codon:yes gene_type:complete